MFGGMTIVEPKYRHPQVQPDHYWKYRLTHLDEIPMTLEWARGVHQHACLSKVMFTEKAHIDAKYECLIEAGINFVYPCYFCHGWHRTSHAPTEGYAAVQKAAARFLGRRPL